MSVDPYRYHKWSSGSYPSSACLCQAFLGIVFVGVFCCYFRGYIKISMAFDIFLSFVFHDINGCSYSFKMKHDNRSFPVV